MLIGIVGPCTAGKSTLISGLATLGVHARHIAQEHSYAPRMWQQITNPDVLIFLDVSHQESLRRRKWNWTLEDYNEQQRRLLHARENASFYLLTDGISIDEVLATVLQYLNTAQSCGQASGAGV